MAHAQARAARQLYSAFGKVRETLYSALSVRKLDVIQNIGTTERAREKFVMNE